MAWHASRSNLLNINTMASTAKNQARSHGFGISFGLYGNSVSCLRVDGVK